MISIAIDGPSGSGKGALSEGLAKKLNLIHLDTGAIFRGIAYGLIGIGLTSPSESQINMQINSFNINIKFENNKQYLLLNGVDITARLRDEEVSSLASKISIYPKVRDEYLKIVRDFVTNNNCIIDGRDITSVVLPSASFKIYLTAREDVRAERRYKENLLKNINCSYNEVYENIKERDYRDSHREIAPLKIVSDATVIDNSNLSIEQTIDICYKMINEKLKIKEIK